MAHRHPRNDEGRQQAVNFELEDIMNTLVFGRQSALEELENLKLGLEILRERVPFDLVPDEHFISSTTVGHIVIRLTRALAACQIAQLEIEPHIRIGERCTRQSLTQNLMNAPALVLDNLSVEEQHKAINEAQQRNLWRRVAHQRLNAVMPPADALLGPEASQAAIVLHQSVESFNAANVALKACLEVAQYHLEEAVRMLSPVLHIPTNTRHSVIQQVHSILADVMSVNAAINVICTGSFESSYSALTSIKDSLLYQRQLAP